MNAFHAEVLPELALQLDGSGSDAEFKLARELHQSLGAELPSIFVQALPRAKRYGARTSFLYHSLRYARVSPDAVKLAQLLLPDKSRHVRYRAAEVLAFSLDRSTLPSLKQALAAFPESEGDFSAAIDAIESQNHHFFQDREHSGMVTWNPIEPVGPGRSQQPKAV